MILPADEMIGHFSR